VIFKDAFQCDLVRSGTLLTAQERFRTLQNGVKTMQQAELIELLGISDSYFRKWRAGLGIEPKASYPDDEVEQFTRIKQELDNGLKLPDAIAQITGKRPEPKQAPGRYSNLPGQLQPKSVAGAMVAQFDAEVMQEFFRLLSQPLTKHEMDRYFQTAIGSDDVLDAYILEAGTDD